MANNDLRSGCCHFFLKDEHEAHKRFQSEIKTIGMNQKLLKRLNIVYVLYMNRFEIRKRNSKDIDTISQDNATENRILLE
jgi:hypothetical protein